MFTIQEIEDLKLLIQSTDANKIKLAFYILENKEIPSAIQQLFDEYKELYNWYYGNDVKHLEEICFCINNETKINLNEKSNFFNTWNFTIPSSIRLFKQLKSFTGLREATFDKLPDTIGELENLETLDLLGSVSTYSRLPETLSNCRKLRNIYLEDISLTTLPENIGNLIDLEILNISGGYLTVLPDSLSKCRKMKELLLSYNQLTFLPDFISQFENLTELNISGNNFENFPSVISKCIGLVRLEICGNSFTTIPNDIGSLKNLKVLDLSENQLTELPDAIIKCEKIEELWLDHNYFKSLPSSIKKLPNLQYLNVENNFFSSEEKNIIIQKYKAKDIKLVI